MGKLNIMDFISHFLPLLGTEDSGGGGGGWVAFITNVGPLEGPEQRTFSGGIYLIQIKQ